MARQKRKRGPVVAKGILAYDLTKIDVAESLLVTAIRLFFAGEHPVPIYQLASSAREILTTIGDKKGVETILHALAKKKGVTLNEMVKQAHTFANFFKHANRDATSTLHFSEDEADTVLAMVCDDFGRITGGMPVEAQIFQVWIMSLAYERVADAPFKEQPMIKFAIQQLPGIRTANRKQQKKFGLELLTKSMTDPSLKMQYSREVQLAQPVKPVLCQPARKK